MSNKHGVGAGARLNLDLPVPKKKYAVKDGGSGSVTKYLKKNKSFKKHLKKKAGSGTSSKKISFAEILSLEATAAENIYPVNLPPFIRLDDSNDIGSDSSPNQKGE